MENYSPMKRPYSLIFITSCLLFFSCANNESKQKTKITIGFSQCTTGDDWRKFMHEEMLREISLYPQYNIELIVKDAHDNNQQQIEDVEALVASDIDILLISPNEAKPLTPIVEKVYDAGIPVIVIDRKIDSRKFTAYIGANNLLIGKEAGRLAADILKGKGKIAMVTGLKGATSAIERSEGFQSIVGEYPNMEIVHTLEGEWLPAIAQQLTDSLFQADQDIDLVFAQNDPMAFGVYLSASKYGFKPHIIGIDGINIPNGGLENVLHGYMDGTIYYPTGGDKAIQLTLDILNNKTVEKFNYLSTFRIDADNARTLTLQGEQIRQQYEKIDLQRNFIASMNHLIQRQRTFLLLLSLTIGLLVLLIGSVIYFLYKKNQINKVLDNKNKTIEQQNKKITQQRDEVIKALKIAEEATETKLSFFTNLSHEFRTTLNMISLPVNDLAAAEKDSPHYQKLRIIQQNTNRLVRLAEEILDFRKIEKHKSSLLISRDNLATFLHKLVTSFTPQAEEKNISLTSVVPEKMEMDFDGEVLDKVVFNLLSNALKNTRHNGTISIKVAAENEQVLIQVQDNGIGISEEHLPYIFDLFYRAPHDHEEGNEQGTGLGLALCKELVYLHSGKLTVSSQLDVGSIFTICLPRYQDKTTITATSSVEKTGKSLEPDFSKTVLIVEDNPGLLNMLADVVSKYFQVIKAKDGQEGLACALEQHPDLIISDIFMPEMDGIELCEEIKKTPGTFQVPVILLTAIDSYKTKVSGFDIGADDYLTKPVNEHLLISRVKNLMESRDKFKHSLGKYQFISESIAHADQADQDFINECVTIIHKHISEESFHLDQLAEKVNMSRSSLYRKLKKVTDIKGVDFIKKIRLQYAAKILLNEDKGVNEAAWLCGFSDVKYFSKCFAKEFNHNPSKFKNAILSARDIKDFV